MIYKPAEDSFFLLRHVLRDRGKTFLDMGCGSGIIGIEYAQQHPKSLVTMVDISWEAINYVRKSVKKAKLKNVEVIQSDLYQNIEKEFEIIAFNPPYLPPETGDINTEDTGTITRFIQETPSYLERQGRAYFILSSLTPKLSEKFNLLKKYDYEILETLSLFFEKLYLIRFYA